MLTTDAPLDYSDPATFPVSGLREEKRRQQQEHTRQRDKVTTQP